MHLTHSLHHTHTISVAGCCPCMEPVDGKQKVRDVLFLDISNAFDKVPHALLDKLKMVGIDGSLSPWIRVYLTNRRQRCIIEGCVSGWIPVTSGVCQGTILDLLLAFPPLRQ